MTENNTQNDFFFLKEMTQQTQKLNDYKTGLENDLIELRGDIKL